MPDRAPALHDLDARARWHLEIGYPASPCREEPLDGFDDEERDDRTCWECGLGLQQCECHEGSECGRWRNGSLDSHCTKAGSEECDFECPYRGSLRF